MRKRAPARRRFLTAGAAAGASASIGILRWPGDAAQFSFKLANDQTPTHPMNVQSADAIKRISDATGGQVEVKLFPNSVLGGDPQMLTQLRSGALELLQIGNNVLGSVIGAAALLSMPFAFTSTQQYSASGNGPLGTYIGDEGAKIGLRKFATTFYGGLFEMQNRVRPIVTPDDLKGLKMRVPPGPIDVGTFRALGASPTVVTLSEVYTSLQTHLIDGIEVPLPTLRNFKFYEQVKYCSLTHHSGLTYLLFANADAWQRLPPKLKTIVDREFDAAAVAASAAFVSQEASVESSLAGEGVIFARPALQPFRDVIRSSGLYHQWKDAYDPKGWEMLEKTTGKLL